MPTPISQLPICHQGKTVYFIIHETSSISSFVTSWNVCRVITRSLHRIWIQHISVIFVHRLFVVFLYYQSSSNQFIAMKRGSPRPNLNQPVEGDSNLLNRRWHVVLMVWVIIRAGTAIWLGIAWWAVETARFGGFRGVGRTRGESWARDRAILRRLSNNSNMILFCLSF